MVFFLAQMLGYDVSFWGDSKNVTLCGCVYNVYLEKKTGICISLKFFKFISLNFGVDKILNIFFQVKKC